MSPFPADPQCLEASVSVDRSRPRFGLTFIGATLDRRVRPFETATGRELWAAELPAGGKATPMTYVARNGRQYVVIAAGGGGLFGAGDAIIAYRLT
jgi:quinoprotein glucose dehydrogenase